MYSSSKSRLGAAAADWRVSALWLLLAALLQATLVHAFAIRGAVPSLVLLVVVSFSLRAPMRAAILFGACAGVLEDALAGTSGAGWTVATALTASLISASSRALFSDSVSLLAALVIVASLVRETVFWVVMSLQGYPPGLQIVHTKAALLDAAYTGLVFLAVGWARWRFAREARR